MTIDPASAVNSSSQISLQANLQQPTAPEAGAMPAFSTDLSVKAPLEPVQIREVKLPAVSAPSSGSGQRVLDYMQSLHQHRARSTTETAAPAPPAVAFQTSSLSGPPLSPGPAARNLSARPEGDQMQSQIAMLRESFDYATGVGLITRTGSSLAGSLNKLMSS